MTNVVFCADGTWNRPGTDDSADQPSYPTNVFKLFTNDVASTSCRHVGPLSDAAFLHSAGHRIAVDRCADADGRVTVCLF